MALRFPIVAFPGLGVDPKSASESWVAFTPQMKMAAGGGTMPTYLTYEGRYLIIDGGLVFCEIAMAGNGGTNGAGASQLYVSLPVVPYYTFQADHISLGGDADNGGNHSQMYGVITAGDLWLPLSIRTSATAIAALTGGDQNNASRSIRIHVWYETLPIQVP